MMTMTMTVEVAPLRATPAALTAKRVVHCEMCGFRWSMFEWDAAMDTLEHAALVTEEEYKAAHVLLSCCGRDAGVL